MNEVLKIRIPASTANLGPGFDTLGMALNLYNYLEVNTKTNGFKIEVFGEGKDYIPKDENNIVYKMMNTIFNRARFKPNGLSIKLEQYSYCKRVRSSSCNCRR